MNKENIKVLPVRELYKYQPIELLDNLKTNLIILFEDNVTINMTYKEIVLQRYVFELNILVPEMAIVSKYCISNFYTNGIYTAKTINKCFEVILEDIVRSFVKPIDSRELLPLCYSRMYDIVNKIYNEIVYANVEYSNSINILDFLEVQFDDNLIEAMKEVQSKKDVDSVNKTYKILDDIMYNKPELKNNIIARGYVAGTVNPNQIKQMLASRGYVTEIDSNIFKYPIASSFVLGMTDIYDLSIESRSGAKALFLSNKAVQESEYFARELQLVTMIVEKLVDGDCGNKDYMDWYVRPKEISGKSDLDNLLGKRFLNEETNKEEVITKYHTNLEGKTIKLRTAMNCKLEDKRCICTACFGDLSYGMHKHTNIGHFSSTEVTQKLTQSILSTKHLTSSATSNDIKLDNNAKLFFNVKNKNNYAFKANLINKVRTSYKMIINQSDAFGLKDLNSNVDVYKLNPARVTRIESIIIVTSDPTGKEEYFPIVIREANKYGSFTYEFLEYIIKEGYTLDDNDRYVINLDNWTSTMNVITMPELEYNFLALAKNIKSEFKYMKIKKGDKSSETPESLLQKLFDLVNTKLDVNIALLEVIIYAFSVMSIKDNNYDLGRNSDDTQLMRIKGIITNRSLGAGYAWEEVVSTILSPRSFDGKNAVSHPLDVLLKPNEVIKEFYGTLKV
ncbi:MAG: hypothetical protein AB7G52_10425 [Arcobacter sp.]